MDIVCGSGADDSVVKVDQGIPIQMGYYCLIRLAVAVEIGGSFHVKDGLAFAAIPFG